MKVFRINFNMGLYVVDYVCKIILIFILEYKWSLFEYFKD